MRDDDQRGFLLLDQLGDGVGARAKGGGLLLGWHLLAGLLGLSGGLQAVLLGQGRLGTVTLQQLEQLHSGLFVGGLGELVHWGRHLQTLLQHRLVTLDADVPRPAHETAQVALGLNILAWKNQQNPIFRLCFCDQQFPVLWSLLTDAKVLGALLEQGVGHFLNLDLLDGGQWGGSHLLSSDLLLGAGLSSGLSSLKIKHILVRYTWTRYVDDKDIPS